MWICGQEVCFGIQRGRESGEGVKMERKLSVGILALLLVPFLCVLDLVAGQNCNSTVPCADPNNCCSQYGYCGTDDAYCVIGCQNGPCRDSPSPPPPPAPPSPPSPPPPPRPSVSPTPSSGAGRLITRKLFEKLYPNYNKTFYSYDAFIVAANAFPKFLNEGCRESRLRELAAWSAHVQQETAGELEILQFVPLSSDIHCLRQNPHKIAVLCGDSSPPKPTCLLSIS